jgi:peptide/nickel transport system permease protein
VGAYFVRRLVVAVPVLAIITLIAFLALSLAPGDPLLARMEPGQLAQLRANPELLEQRRQELGLNDPIHIRYLTWLAGVVTKGDLGYSLQSGRPVLQEVSERIVPTLALMGMALLLSILVGVPLGILAALRQYSRLDYALATFSALMVSTPNFVLGLAGIYVFGVWFNLIPTVGMQTLGEPFSIGDFLAHAILPATVLALSSAAALMRYTRASMLEVLNSDYVVTATAKGLAHQVVVVRHAFRNALIPVITVIGLLLPQLVAGAVITEQIFTWPGMGQLAVRAARDRDPALMMGVVIVVGIAVLATNILIDALYARIDPRIRFDSAR